jgi:hypothetical protein
MDFESAFQTIESILVRDSNRGAPLLAEQVRGDLKLAATSIVNTQDRRVVIVTGYNVPTPAGSTPETDGPVGAAVLASACLTIGAQVSVVTDFPCALVVRAALRGFGGLESVPVLVAQSPTSSGEFSVADLVKKFDGKTSHVVFIERPGLTAENTYRSMKGMLLNDVARLDDLADLNDAFVIAIGDGGNEVGMGKIPAAVISSVVNHGSDIASVTDCDALIVSGVSNWGAFGLAASILSLSSPTGPDHFASLDLTAHRSSLKSSINAGAVDGVTGEFTESVDGYEWSIYSQVLQAILTIAEFAGR